MERRLVFTNRHLVIRQKTRIFSKTVLRTWDLLRRKLLAKSSLIAHSSFDVLLSVHLSIFISAYLWYHHTYRCDDTRVCVIQFWPPDDEHMCSKHIEAWNKLTVKQKFCSSSWLITEIKHIVGLEYRHVCMRLLPVFA